MCFSINPELFEPTSGLLFLFMILYTSSFAQKEVNHFELGIDGGMSRGRQASHRSFATGGSLRYVAFFKDDPNSLNFLSLDDLGFIISGGAYKIFGKKNVVINGLGTDISDILIVPIMVGSKIPIGKRYLSSELGWSYSDIKGNKNNFSFSFGTGFVWRSVDAGLHFLGTVGNDLFIGITTLQLTFKF